MRVTGDLKMVMLSQTLAGNRTVDYNDETDTYAVVHPDGTRELRVALKDHWVLRVRGYFDSDGFNITSVIGNGPATDMSSPDGSVTGASLEVGDIITQVELNDVQSPNAFANAMNGAPNHAKTRITVWDHSSDQESDWIVSPIHKP